MPGPTLRLFTPADDAPCRRLASRAAMSSYGERLEGARQALADPDTPLDETKLRLVATIDGEIVGFVDIDDGHISNLLVDPQVQGRRIGERLLQAAEDAITGDVTLNVFTVNPRARAFYERHGYGCIGTKSIVFHGEQAELWRMVKRR